MAPWKCSFCFCYHRNTTNSHVAHIPPWSNSLELHQWNCEGLSWLDGHTLCFRQYKTSRGALSQGGSHLQQHCLSLAPTLSLQSELKSETQYSDWHSSGVFFQLQMHCFSVDDGIFQSELISCWLESSLIELIWNETLISDWWCLWVTGGGCTCWVYRQEANTVLYISLFTHAHSVCTLFEEGKLEHRQLAWLSQCPHF